MELKEQLKLYQKNFLWIVLITILVVVLSAGWALMRPAQYEANISFGINIQNREDTAEYTFDGFYKLQASDLQADTISSWFASPALVKVIYENAGLELEEGDIAKLKSIFETKKLAPQNLQVTFKNGNEDDAEALAQSAIDFVAERTANSSRTSDDKPIFATMGDYVVVESQISPVLAGVLGLIVGVGLGIGVVNFKEYWRE